MEQCGACRGRKWRRLGLPYGKKAGPIYQCEYCDNYLLKTGEVLRCPTCFSLAREFEKDGAVLRCGRCGNLLKYPEGEHGNFELALPAELADMASQEGKTL